ncbi:hypothetical protein EDD18DRAFT_1358050 [Armillaria luteobubalina]|uniref:Uncharacterized protein n=1 Tax=Armillaria luteobubalina TaxID=153913 RepID=A0AA39PYB4_9AGAR|nr:hypothetical protein EDD18DRAFT_1358050 [Armillaria luteobubalina]
MNVQPPNLSQDEKSFIFEVLDISLNNLLLNAFLHGLYTGIVAVTLWAISTSTNQGRFPTTIILMLYCISTITFVLTWGFLSCAFIEHGYNYYSVLTAPMVDSPWHAAWDLVGGISGGISTLLVDVTIIWRCWELWDRQWRIVSVPIIFAVTGTTVKILQIISIFRPDIGKTGGITPKIGWELTYCLLTLVVNLTCTILMVYRIVRLAHTLFFFRCIIFTLIDSSAANTLALIVFLVLEVKNMGPSEYAESFAEYIRAIAPTLLVLRVTTGWTSSSYEKESDMSITLSDICFNPMDENSCDDSSDQSFSEEYRISVTESV